MIPVYLSDLELPYVFAQYCKSPEKYMRESNADEHIVDSDRKKSSGFVTAHFGQEEDKADKYFSIVNQSGHSYSLLLIDKGLIKTPLTKKCDCAVVNSKDLLLIEFKANALTDNPLRIDNNYQKAIEQILATMNIFAAYYRTINVSLKDLRNVEAYICFRHGYPKNTASQMNYQVSFAQRSGGIPLSFKQERILK